MPKGRKVGTKIIGMKRPLGLKYKWKNHKGFENGVGKPSFAIKGTHLSPETEFKKGEHISFETEFKKGQYSWNKDKRIWHGNKKEYSKIHAWVRKTLGNPTECIKCGSKHKLVWANKSQKYIKKEDDWMKMCRSCHMKNDFNYIIKIYGK